ncbi:CPBP family intramembrane metalloprotease [Brevibacillus ruminantium]|uniref:CPBP family intramembrane metalloprotease n=1 Tax=Brevibacillus ruminantium TaxID=2950604 RepID=A0ABY4W9F5_9BACL|nr:CPBP family intramembrane glutamic endopeptidase [Brevibacillus ruminantium]USG63549.1 CPBP family intramembrane metalloprotease [Brevibacillus ruminantium]
MKQEHPMIDETTLRYHLWLTQFVVIMIAVAGSLLVHGWENSVALFRLSSAGAYLWALGIALVVVLSSIAMDRFLPPRWQDDGSVNERIFTGLTPGKTILLCALIGVGEEWLFRGVIQSLIGNLWTSLLFTLVHVRYLTKPLLVGSVFLTSWLLGNLFQADGQLLPPILAHIVIDLLLAFYIQFGFSRERRSRE